MHPLLVRAKLQRPAASLSTVARPHLIERLYDSIKGKVTLVSAPAGFGKSTLVNAWLDQVETEEDENNTPLIKVSWLGLEAADNQLPRFLRYVVAAIEESYPQSCGAVTRLLQAQPLATIEALADTLADTLSLLPGQLILVLDDLHLLNDDAIHTFLTHLIQHTTNRLHLVLITRVDPPLPLNRWRAQGHLFEVRLPDLCFTLEETKSYLTMTLKQPPKDEVVATLYRSTEGWVVGLRLAALALAGTTNYAALVAGFEANSNRYIIDYLVDDVLNQQSPGVQQFLVCTSILPRFCPELCAALLEIDKGAAQQLINHVARANLFLIALGSPTDWYRYHHQFQNMLLSRLHERYDPQAIAMLHRQAAAWLASHGQIDEALRHLIAIADFAAAADLIESQRVEALNLQNFHELDGWLALLPAHVLNERPALLIGVAWVQNYWLNDTQSLSALQRAEVMLREQSDTLSEITQKLLQAEMYALRIVQDRPQDHAQALRLIRHHWKQIRPYLSYTHWNPVVTLSHVCYFMGGSELSLEMLNTTYEQTTEWPQMARSRLLYSAGILYWYSCNLAQAERAFQQSLHLARLHNLYLATTLSQFGLALIATLRNQQELAEVFHLEVLKEPHYQNGLRAVFSAYSLIGLYAARGEPEAGRSMVEALKAHAMMIGRPYLLIQVTALEAYLALACGELGAALRWELGASRSEMYRHEDRVPLIRVRILIAEGSTNSLQKAAQILEKLVLAHEREYRWSLWVEALIMEALVWTKMDELDRALLSLGKVVQRAVPNGLVGPFVEHGQAMQQLLGELGKHAEYAQIAQLLLTAFPSEKSQATTLAPFTHVNAELLQEPLTTREIDILKLLAGRLSNKEIAQELIVSVHTVRNHTVNIFGKLQVANRVEAVERARSLGILPNEKQRSTLANRGY
jgi:LuxR family maltose regulon positive regulatory protein